MNFKFKTPLPKQTDDDDQDDKANDETSDLNAPPHWHDTLEKILSLYQIHFRK